MDYLIWFIIIFVIVFLFYLLWVNRRKLKLEKYNKMGEINYLIYRYKLDKEKIDYNALSNIIALANAFIIALVGTILILIPLHYLWKMAIGLVLIIGSILIVYGFIGRYLIKKEEVKK